MYNAQQVRHPASQHICLEVCGRKAQAGQQQVLEKSSPVSPCFYLSITAVNLWVHPTNRSDRIYLLEMEGL